MAMQSGHQVPLFFIIGWNNAHKKMIGIEDFFPQTDEFNVNLFAFTDTIIHIDSKTLK